MLCVKLDLAVSCHSIWPSIYCSIISACDLQRINMAKKELTRKDFQQDFPTLRGFFLQTSRLTKEDLKARDELYKWYQENRMHWVENGTRYTLEEHVATLAILHFHDFQNAKKICISFNGSVSCLKEACTFMHKCLFCGCKDPQRCSFRKKLVQERALFWERYNLDPFDPNMCGLGETDATLQDTLRRLAKDPPKPKGKKTLETGSVGSMPSLASGHFGALQSDDEAPDGEEGNASNAGTKPTEPEETEEATPRPGLGPVQSSSQDPVPEPEPVFWKSRSEHGKTTERVTKQYQVGFLCTLEDSELKISECSREENLVHSDQKKQNVLDVAAKALGKPREELKEIHSERMQVVAVYHLRSQSANRLATSFLHAGEPKLRNWLVKGDACFIASKDCTLSSTFKPDWPVFEEGIEADKERFDLWFKEKTYELKKRKKIAECQQGGPGDMLFIPVDQSKEYEWFSESPSGYPEIAKRAKSIFASKGSSIRKMGCCAAESSDEETTQRTDVVGCFHQEQLDYSFAKRQHKLAAVTCKKEIIAPQKSTQLNVRAALILGKLYGVSLLKKNYLKRLRGDTILCMVAPSKELRPRTDWAIQELDCEFPEFLQNLETCEDEEEVRPLVMLEEMRTWSFAWLDYGQMYSKTLQKLEEMAQPEDWMMRIDDDESESGLPYLESYLQFKFAFSLHRSKETELERGIGFRREGQVLVFATGLLRKTDLQPICGVFESRSARTENLMERPKLEARYKFKKWATIVEETSTKVEPLDLLTDECMKPAAERDQLQLHELKSFDPYAPMETPDACLNHIAQKLERFGSDNDQQQFKKPNGWALDNEDRLKDQVKKQLEKVCAWCRTDRSIPIMTVFGDFTYQWLVPLPNPSQEDGKLSENPTLVAVLQCIRKDPKDNPCYVLRTVLTLDMALMQARLCGKLHQRWTVSQRQAVELQKVIDAVKEIPTGDLAVKKAVQNVKESLKKYKECITRFLPSVSNVEDCVRESSRTRGVSSGASTAVSVASDYEEEPSNRRADTDSGLEAIGELRRAIPPAPAAPDPWDGNKDPWSFPRAEGHQS